MRVLVLILAASMLCGVLTGTAAAATSDDHWPPVPPSAGWAGGGGDFADDDGFISGEVLASADSLEQAQEIAAAYGLALKSYAYGIAVLDAPDPQTAVAQSMAAHSVTRQGEKLLPQLGLNRIYHTCETAYNYARLPDTYGDYKAPFMYKYVADKQPVFRRAAYTSEYPDGAEPPGFLHSVGAESPGQWHRDEMDMERAWPISTGEGVVVAVVDTGIDISHPAFAGRISAKSYNAFTDKVGLENVRDDLGHGTHVSGIIAASMDEVADVCGVAPDAGLLVIKVNKPNSDDYAAADIFRGINYAVDNGANIINLSLGRPYAGGADSVERSTIVNAVARGVTVVCAAGNSRDSHASYPAAYQEAIAVSATRPGYSFDGVYSNYGAEIDVAAPGSDIYSTIMGGEYGFKTGTSMAAPNTAGIAALILSLHPGYTPQQVRKALCDTARDAGVLGRDDYYGDGIVNAYAAMLGSDALKTVTYYYGYSGPAPVAVKVISGDTLIEPYCPQRPTYAFAGWYYRGTDDEYDFADPVTDDIELEAKWVSVAMGMYISEFPDANFRREVLRLLNGLDGGNRTESSLVADDLAVLASIVSLRVEGQFIHIITGLQYFSGLEELWCYSNYLNALDATNNAALKELYCSENNLAALDVSNNTALATLDCWVNQLTVLDISNNTALEELDCGANILTALNISKNTALKWLNCSYNELTSLDVSKNTMLSELYCTVNRLSALDVSKNTLLRELYCNVNLISTLDVSKNIVLQELGCNINQLSTLNVTQNTLLEWLDCAFNLLTGLNVSNNSQLIVLACDDNELFSLNVKNTKLTYLKCSDNQLTSLDITGLPLNTLFWCQHNFMDSVSDVRGFTGTWDNNFFCFDPQFLHIYVTAGMGGRLFYEGGYSQGIDFRTFGPHTLTAVPDSGYTFDGWYEGSTKVSANTVYTFTVTTNRTLQARFTSSGGGGPAGGGGGAPAGASISPSKTTFDVNGGKDISINLDKSGFTLRGLKNGNTSLKEGTDYTVSGNTVTIKAEYLASLGKGEHTIVFEMSGGGNPKLTITITDTTTEQQPEGPTYRPMAPAHAAGTRIDAAKTNNLLLLDGKETQFPAVKISDYNWLKLRDFAKLLSGSSKQFDISYDAATGIIDIRTGQAYQPLGDELEDKLAATETAIASPQRIRVDGEFIEVAAYNIKGYNYFRLRDLAIILNFSVIYEDETGKITLDFDNPYSE